VVASQEFEVDTHRVKKMELLNLRQTWPVEKYKHQFDQLVYHIRLYDSNIGDTMLVSQFLLALKSELRHPVEMHLSNSVAQAGILAYVQEHLNDRNKSSHKKFSVSKLDNKGSFNSIEMWKARQLKEYMRVNNLCFKCEEKFTPNHICSTAISQLITMQNVAVDGGDILSDEMLEALETPQLCMMNDDGYLSLHALSG
jgi:hypothetical protein